MYLLKINFQKVCEHLNPEMKNLIEDVKSGVPLSFDAVYSLYTPLIRSLAEKYRAAYSLSAEDEDDIRQEAAIALYDAALSYNDRQGVSFGLYAKICIRNRIVSFLRRRQGTSIRAESLESADDVALPQDDQTPEKIIISRESVSDIRKKIGGSLTDLERSVFDLYLVGASYEDVSAALGIPKKSIDNAMQRIKSKLRKLL